MIGGALAGLLVMVAYVLVTGKLQLTKARIVYGGPARLTALAGLLPLVILVAYAVTTKRYMVGGEGLAGILTAIIASIVLIYAIGWPLGGPPR